MSSENSTALALTLVTFVALRRGTAHGKTLSNGYFLQINLHLGNATAPRQFSALVTQCATTQFGTKNLKKSSVMALQCPESFSHEPDIDF